MSRLAQMRKVAQSSRTCLACVQTLKLRLEESLGDGGRHEEETGHSSFAALRNFPADQGISGSMMCHNFSDISWVKIRELMIREVLKP